MKKNKNTQHPIVYSTNPEFLKEIQDKFHSNEKSTPQTLPPPQQKLKVSLNTKIKPGKKITIIENFIGSPEDLEKLAKELKTRMGVGGSVQNNQIWLQGDCVLKVTQYLKSQEYQVK